MFRVNPRRCRRKQGVQDTREPRRENRGETIDRLSGHKENERRMAFSSPFEDRSWRQTPGRIVVQIERERERKEKRED